MAAASDTSGTLSAPASAQPTSLPGSALPRLVADPGTFRAETFVFYDGGTTQPGAWIDFEGADIARRVRLTNAVTGAQVDAAMLPHAPILTGPRVVISAEAARGLGLEDGGSAAIVIEALVYVSDDDLARAPAPGLPDTPPPGLAASPAAAPGTGAEDASAIPNIEVTTLAPDPAAAPVADPEGAPDGAPETAAPPDAAAAATGPEPAGTSGPEATPPEPAGQEAERQTAPDTARETAIPPNAGAPAEVPAAPPTGDGAQSSAGTVTEAVEAALDALTSGAGTIGSTATTGPPEAQTDAQPETQTEAQPVTQAVTRPTPKPAPRAVPAEPAAPPAPDPAASEAQITDAPITDAPITDGQRFVQVGVFAETDAAAASMATFRAAGLPVTVRALTLGGKQLSRVLVGPFETTAGRDRALATVRRIGPADAAPASG